MSGSASRFNWIHGSVLVWLLATHAVLADIVPDNTLPNRSIVFPDCFDCEITGGTQKGSNLFHSFRRFSVPDGGRAYFNNGDSIRNIFVRVTGRSASRIDGLLEANGQANLFLLNPHGILFGPNASLNIGGSFVATTADHIRFRDGAQFSAAQPQTSLLTVSVPVGLQFGPQPGSITNQSQALDPQTFTSVGLQVPTGRSLLLVGRGVFLDNSRLTAPGGRVALASVEANSAVDLRPTPSGFTFNEAGFQALANTPLANIQINNSRIVTSSEQGAGGAITLYGQTIRLVDSTLRSNTAGGRGGDLQIQASDSVMMSNASAITFARAGQAGNVRVMAGDRIELSGATSGELNSPDPPLPRILGSQTEQDSSGKAGNVFIQADRLSLQNGFQIEASTFGTGEGGNIDVRAAKIELAGYNPLPLGDGMGITIPVGQRTSGILSQSEAGQNAGRAGNIQIHTDRLTIKDGGFVSAATFAGGDGGTLRIDATDSIQVQGASSAVQRNQYRSGIFVSAEPRATGNVGALTLTTPQLIVDDRAEISANNRGSNNRAGSATLRVGTLTIQGGGEIRASSLGSGPGGRLTVRADAIQIRGSGLIGSERVPSALSALARDAGNAGNLSVLADRINITGGGEISVSGTGTGAAGNLILNAGVVNLDEGYLTAATNAGSGASIQLSDLDLLLLNRQSQLTATANNRANGGNITINSPQGFVIAAFDRNNDIVATAFEGRGGAIRISSKGLLGLEEQRALPNNLTNDIDASSEFGQSGTIVINSVDVDPTRGLAVLPTDIAIPQLAEGCQVEGGQVTAEFFNSGRGGSPDTPYDALSNSAPLDDLRLPPSASAPSFQAIVPPPSQTIVEAQGWRRNAAGNMTLVAEPIASPLHQCLLRSQAAPQ